MLAGKRRAAGGSNPAEASLPSHLDTTWLLNSWVRANGRHSLGHGSISNHDRPAGMARPTLLNDDESAGAIPNSFGRSGACPSCAAASDGPEALQREATALPAGVDPLPVWIGSWQLSWGAGGAAIQAAWLLRMQVPRDVPGLEYNPVVRTEGEYAMAAWASALAAVAGRQAFR